MERYGLSNEMSRRQVNELNELVRDNQYLQSFRVCGHRGQVLEVELTEEGFGLDDPDKVIREFLMNTIGLEPEFHYPHRRAA